MLILVSCNINIDKIDHENNQNEKIVNENNNDKDSNLSKNVFIVPIDYINTYYLNYQRKEILWESI